MKNLIRHLVNDWEWNLVLGLAFFGLGLAFTYEIATAVPLYDSSRELLLWESIGIMYAGLIWAYASVLFLRPPWAIVQTSSFAKRKRKDGDI